MSKLKGFKVSLAESDLKKGVGAKSLDDLRQKVVIKFQLPTKPTSVFIFLPDGTEVDDEEYFQNLPPQSNLVASINCHLKSSSPLTNAGSLDHFLESLRWHGAREAVELIRELLLRDGSGEDLSLRWQTIANYVQNRQNQTTSLSTIEEDPDWFQNLSTNAKTKEEYLSKSCQARVRGYLAKAESQLKATNLSAKSKTQRDFEIHTSKILNEFRRKLKENKFYGHYFDRKSESSDQICDNVGQFLCEGQFDEDVCFYNCKNENPTPVHVINPYESPEARVLFSTWNLDHVIERSRSIVPALVEAIENIGERTLNVGYFHDLLFTRFNLKLVHIVCHCKKEHVTKKCDSERFYKTPESDNLINAKTRTERTATQHAETTTKKATVQNGRIVVTPPRRSLKLMEKELNQPIEPPVSTRKRKICNMA